MSRQLLPPLPNAVKNPTPVNFAQVGIEYVTVAENPEVAHADMMTRSRTSADMLESAPAGRSLRFARGSSILHAIPRAPAAARQWLEEHGLVAGHPEADECEDNEFWDSGVHASPHVMTSVQLYGGLVTMFLVGLFAGLLCAGVFELYR
jgi:hypothetical protein